MATSSALLLCLVAALAVVATSQPLKNPPDFTINNPGAKTTVKIGCLLPFSGDYAVKGIAAHNGIKLALADFAAQNKGYNFVLTCLDSQCSAEYAKTAAATMKTRGVAGVIGEICSSASLAAKEVLAPILLVSPTSTSSKLTIAGDNFFRIISADKFQAVVLANLIKGSGAAAPVGIVADTGAYGTSLADSFTASYKKIGGTVPTRVTITPTNAAAAAQELAKAGIKKVLIATNNDTWTAQFLAAGAALPGFLPDLYSGDAQFNPELPAKTASFGKTTLLDRLTVTAYNQGTKAFQDRYAKSTKDVYTGHAAHAFDAATVVLASYFADAKGGKPVATVSTVTPLKTSLVGASGNIKFDAAGDLIPDDTTYQSVVYKGGKPVVGAFLPLGAA